MRTTTVVSTPPAIRALAWHPSPVLRPFVDLFGFRVMKIGSAQVYHPLPARTDCFLEFYFEDRFRVINVATGAIHAAPRAVLVGPHSRRREDLLLGGNLRVFHIQLSPIGFRALFRIPASAIRDCAESADQVLGTQAYGPWIREFEEQLAEAPAANWPRVAERFLLQRLTTGKAAPDGRLAAQIVHALQTQPESLSIARAAASHGRSVRHMERLFEDHIGVSPKLFSRIARLQSVLRMSQQQPQPDWASLACSAGYFDQSHMVRDFRALTGVTPVHFQSLRQRSPVHVLPQSAPDVAFVLSPQPTC